MCAGVENARIQLAKIETFFSYFFQLLISLALLLKQEALAVDSAVDSAVPAATNTAAAVRNDLLQLSSISHLFYRSSYSLLSSTCLSLLVCL